MIFDSCVLTSLSPLNMAHDQHLEHLECIYYSSQRQKEDEKEGKNFKSP